MAAAVAVDIRAGILSKPEAVGLAVIVSNDYNKTGLKPLTGTHNDGTRMNDTFEALGFATFSKRNADMQQMYDILHAVSQFKNYPQSYKCITIVFSGHGGCETQKSEKGRETQLKYLYTQDEGKIEVEALVAPFLPQNAKQIGNIPKLFFIDACRGSKDMHELSVLVPRGGNGSEAECEVLRKGANEVVRIDVPSEGNFLIAYSTITHFQSYEVKHDGGVWMKLLAEKIRTGVNDSVTDVLTDVNEELLQRFQDKHWRVAMTQPEFICRLLGTVKLHQLRSK